VYPQAWAAGEGSGAGRRGCLKISMVERARSPGIFLPIILRQSIEAKLKRNLPA
jgi:hypothetical protein